MVLIRDRERLRDVKVEGNVGEPDAFAEAILERIMRAVKDAKSLKMRSSAETMASKPSTCAKSVPRYHCAED
jgi:hypothetical protein